MNKAFHICLLLMALILTACGRGTEEEIQEAITEANILLSTWECDKAIGVLEGVGRQNNNATYLQILASAYACKASFSEIDFFANDVKKTDPQNLLVGMSTYEHSSSMSAPNHVGFINMQKAIDILWFSGALDPAQNPTHAARLAVFPIGRILDIYTQTFWMVMSQLGRYAYFYGNTSGAGTKGGGGRGAANNQCFLNYSNVTGVQFCDDNDPPNCMVGDIATWLSSGQTGSCDDISRPGHSDLGNTGSLNVERMCQGVVLMNLFLELLPRILDGIAGDSYDELEDLFTFRALIDNLKDLLRNAKPGMDQVVDVASQIKCVADNTDNDEFLQIYFALLMEQMLI